MKKLSTLASLLFLAMSMMTTSCSNDEGMDAPAVETAHQMTREQVVDILKGMEFDNAMSQEIHGYVTRSLDSGRDEYVRIADLINEQTRSDGQSLFGARLMQLFMNKCLTRSMEVEDMLKELTNSDFVIYWPYSEDWDGKELPTLVAAPDDDDALEAIGIKIAYDENGIKFEEVLVDEGYTMQHPVWVVNTKIERNGMKYTTLVDENETEFAAPKFSTRATADTIHVWKLHKMQVTHQYDGPFKGGPDIEIHISYPTTLGSVNSSTIHQISFSRKDVKKKRWKELNLILNSDWTEDQLDNGIFIIEQDWDGKSATVRSELSLSYKNSNGMTGLVTASIKYSTNDEFIGKQVLKRSYMLHNSELSYHNGRVNMIAPIEKQIY